MRKNFRNRAFLNLSCNRSGKVPNGELESKETDHEESRKKLEEARKQRDLTQWYAQALEHLSRGQWAQAVGKLEQVIGRYVEYQRLVEAIRRKIIGALTYPAVLIVLAAGLIVILMAYVIPSFSQFYIQFETELPLPTRVVIGSAEFIKNNLLLIVAGLIGFWYAFRVWRTSPSGRLITDRWKLRLPLVGRLTHLFALSQFSRSMSILLGGGTPMVPALETASTSVSNSYISELFLGCVQEVQEGRPLSDALVDTGHLPDMALAMIRVGESTGALPEMLSLRLF